MDEALEFLKGGSVASVKDMTQQMNEAAENLEFERAARIRDRISAVKRITAKQKVVATKVREQDVVAMAQAAGAAAHACVVVFRFSGGRLCRGAVSPSCWSSSVCCWRMFSTLTVRRPP